jgi:hypothetical protein
MNPRGNLQKFNAPWRWLIARSLALNVADDPAQVSLQLPGLCIGLADLAGMRSAGCAQMRLLLPRS